MSLGKFTSGLHWLSVTQILLEVVIELMYFIDIFTTYV